MSSSIEFEKALDAFQKTWTLEQKATFLVTRLSDVEAEIERIEEKQKLSRSQRGLARMHSFLIGLRTISPVIDTFVQMKPEFLAAIWGPIKLIIQWAHTTKEAFDLILDTFRDIGECLPLAKTLENVASDSVLVRDAVSRIYTDILDVLSEVLRLLRKKAWKQIPHILWHATGPRVDSIRRRILSHRDSLTSGAVVADIQQGQRFYAESRARFKDEDKLRAEQSLQEAEEWLGNPSSEDDIQTFEDLLEDTAANGQWLSSNELFQTWISDTCDNNVLFLSGIPGSGKTLLTYQIVSAMLPSLASEPVTVAMFLTENESSLQRKSDPAVYTLQAMILQLIYHDKETLLPVFHDFRTRAPKLTAKTRKSFEGLLSRLLEVTELDRIYIVLDGLDEIHHDKAALLLKFLTATAAQYESIRLLISSRNIPTLKSILCAFPTIQTNELNHADIQAYINTRQAKLKDELNLDEDEASSIAKNIFTKCEGMFLYCRLMFETLRCLPTLESLRQAVNDLPSGLDEAYARIIRGILCLAEPQRQVAIRLLEFLVCAKGRTRTLEIRKTFNIQPKDRGFTPENELRKGLDELCGPLIDCRQGVVRFVHFTAKEFILSKESGGVIAEAFNRENSIQSMPRSHRFGFDANQIIFPILKSEANRQMSLRIFRYLQFTCFDEGIDQETLMDHIKRGDYVWLSYANKHWLDHLRQALSDDGKDQREIEEHLLEFMKRWQSNEEPVLKNESPQYLEALSGLKATSSAIRSKLADAIHFRHQSIEGASTSIRDPLLLNEFERNVRTSLDQFASSIIFENDTKRALNDLYGENVYLCGEKTCKYYSEGFSSKIQRENHLKMHNRPYKCQQSSCEYSNIGFHTASKLSTHSIVHLQVETVTKDLENLNPFEEVQKQTSNDRLDPGSEEWLDHMQHAIHIEDIQRIEELIDNDTESIQTTKLIVSTAAAQNSVQIVDHFVKTKNFDLNYKAGRMYKKYFNHPLIEARTTEMASYLLGNGANPCFISICLGKTYFGSIYEATVFAMLFYEEKLNEDIISLILQHRQEDAQNLLGLGFKKSNSQLPSSKENYHDYPNNGNYYVWSIAARGGHLQAWFLFVLKSGFSISSDVAYGVLSIDCAKFSVSLLTSLLESCEINQRLDHGPLKAAIVARDLVRFETFAYQGYITSETINTCLIWAIDNGFVECVKLLIELKADVNYAIKTKYRQRSAFESALFSTHKTSVEILKLLLQAGADPFKGAPSDHYIDSWEHLKENQTLKIERFERRAGMSIEQFLWNFGIDVEALREERQREQEQEREQKKEQEQKEQFLEQQRQNRRELGRLIIQDLHDANIGETKLRESAIPEARLKKLNEIMFPTTLLRRTPDLKSKVPKNISKWGDLLYWAHDSLILPPRVYRNLLNAQKLWYHEFIGVVVTSTRGTIKTEEVTSDVSGSMNELGGELNLDEQCAEEPKSEQKETFSLLEAVALSRDKYYDEEQENLRQLPENLKEEDEQMEDSTLLDTSPNVEYDPLTAEYLEDWVNRDDGLMT